MFYVFSCFVDKRITKRPLNRTKRIDRFVLDSEIIAIVSPIDRVRSNAQYERVSRTGHRDGSTFVRSFRRVTRTTS